MPADDGLWLNDNQQGSPVRAKSGQTNPKDAIAWTQLRTLYRLLVNGNLLAQREVLYR